MKVDFKHRKFVQYSLVIITLLIQIGVLIFFYNEYFNENKLLEIRKQIDDAKKLKNLTKDSKYELSNAQNHLHNYLDQYKKEDLERYFQSLRKVTDKIDSAKIYENTDSESNRKERQTELTKLETLIDSIRKSPEKLKIKKVPLKININTASKVETEEVHISDSVPKKNFFSRLKDAFKGNVDVKTDTVLITTKYNSVIDTAKIKNDFDSTLNLVNKQHLSEIKKYNKNIESVQSNNYKVYDIYNNLIALSNNLIDVYDVASNDLSTKLEQQYSEKFSSINKIRKYTVFSLMLLLFIVLIIMAYFTKLSFVYEKELKEAGERVRSNLKFKNRILGMLSHEIRTPLKILNIYINRISKKTTDESIVESLKSIRFTNDSLLIQATQILDYTKNRDRKIVLNPVQFNLKEDIETFLNIFKPYIESANNELEIHNEIPEAISVFADKSKIHQIFINLLGNANKFTENGKISVHLKTSFPEKNALKLHATIADTGIGISENDIKKIFEPYYKGSISEDVENLGAGLGLNLCKEIVELFRGKISIKSKRGEGTAIDFEINLKVLG
ncbi:MAG: HAMP domain-containing histidine kinase [Flavobacteriaceae bacterium]|nr:HAMP domain-containing histidine kinase [Flavobacteriaceae bacterium]